MQQVLETHTTHPEIEYLEMKRALVKQFGAQTFNSVKSRVKKMMARPLLESVASASRLCTPRNVSPTSFLMGQRRATTQSARAGSGLFGKPRSPSNAARASAGRRTTVMPRPVIFFFSNTTKTCLLKYEIRENLHFGSSLNFKL